MASGSTESRAVLGRSIGSLMVRVAGAALSLGSGVVLGRVLGTDGYGEYAYATAWFNLLLVPASLRANMLLVRLTAAHEVRGEWGALRWLIGRLFTRVALASVAVFGIAVVATHLVLASGRAPDALDGRTMTIVCAALPIVALGQVAQGFVEARRWTVRSQLPELVWRQAVPLAVVAAGWIYGWTIGSAYVAALILGGSALFLVTQVSMGRAAAPGALRDTHATPAPEALHGRIRPLVVTGVLMAVTQQTGPLILGALSDASEVGTYVAGSRFAAALAFVPASVNVAYATTAATLWARGERRQLEALAQRAAMASTLTNGVLTLVLAVFARPLLGIIGSGFEGGAPTMIVLALGQLASSAGGPNGITLVMTGHEREAAIGMGISAATTVIVTALLTPVWGGLGAALGGAIGFLSWNLALGFLIRRRLDIGVSVFSFLTAAMNRARRHDHER